MNNRFSLPVRLYFFAAWIALPAGAYVLWGIGGSAFVAGGLALASSVVLGLLETLADAIDRDAK